MTQLATCSFSEFRPEMGHPVRTSLGTPKWIKYPLPVAWDNVMPAGWMLKMGPDEYRRAYYSKLERVGIDRLQEDVEHIAAAFAHNTEWAEAPLVLLCFEGLRNPAKWCHRTMLAEWWTEHTGEPVVELGATHQPPITEPEPPALF